MKIKIKKRFKISVYQRHVILVILIFSFHRRVMQIRQSGAVSHGIHAVIGVLDIVILLLYVQSLFLAALVGIIRRIFLNIENLTLKNLIYTFPPSNSDQLYTSL